MVFGNQHQDIIDIDLDLPDQLHFKDDIICNVFAFGFRPVFIGGPDGKGASKIYQTFTNKNFLYYEHKVEYPGQYIFYLDNMENSDISEASFAVKDDLKKDKNIGIQKLDTISEYLDDIDEKIKKIRLKQNMINKKTEAHNDSVNKYNKEILIYSLAEVGTMVLIVVGQLFYIKSKVDKI